MELTKWLRDIFSGNKIPHRSTNEKLSFDDLYRHLSGSNGWLQSELVNYADPHGFTSQFRRRVRIFYNAKWHRGRFKLWQRRDKKDSNKFFIVDTKSGRKMLVPKEKIYFKQKHKKWAPVPHNDYFEIYTILTYVKGDIGVYEKMYKKLKN